MAENIAVSVVIPFYDHVDWLTEAVDSVLAQTFSEYEIIVINDGSREDISEFLQKYGDQIEYHFKTNGGPATARNLGIELAKGKYIAFLDSDDLWYHDKLERQVELMEETGAVWSQTNWHLFHSDDPNRAVKFYKSDCCGRVFPRSLISARIGTPCVMVRADILKKRIDLRFQEKMRFGQDYYLWVLLSAEHLLRLIPDALTMVRVRRNNAQRRARAHLQVRAQIWEYLKKNKRDYFFRKKSYFPIRAIYRVCSVQHSLIGRIERFLRPSAGSVEFLSKVLYAFPFFCFHFLKICYPISRSKKNQ